MNNLDCIYINLDSAQARRTALEANFAACQGAGWTLSRFAAIDVAHVGAQQVPGTLRAAEKACFLSHKLAIGARLGGREPLFILEDDALLGRSTARLVDQTLAANRELEWDLMYTDLCVPHASSMLELVRLRRQLAPTGEARLINLRQFPFAGATAYVINPRSIAKVHALLEIVKDFDLPYDLHLMNLVRQGRLTAFTLFPFVTSLSEEADTSQVQTADGNRTDLVWNLFRKMVWIDRDLQRHRHVLDEVDRMMCDEEGRSFATLFAAMASSDFGSK